MTTPIYDICNNIINNNNKVDFIYKNSRATGTLRNIDIYFDKEISLYFHVAFGEIFTLIDSNVPFQGILEINGEQIPCRFIYEDITDETISGCGILFRSCKKDLISIEKLKEIEETSRLDLMELD